MQRFEPGAIMTDDILGYLWGKLGYGALLFATAVTDDSIADVLADGGASPDAGGNGARSHGGGRGQRTAAEGLQRLRSASRSRRAATREAVDASMAEMVAFNRRSAKPHSGIWRDLAVRKRKTEVDAQLGPIVAEGAAAGVPTPVIRRLIAMIHEIEDGARPLDGREPH